MKRKKILSLMTVVTLSLSLIGCGASSSNNTADSSIEADSNTEADDSTADSNGEVKKLSISYPSSFGPEGLQAVVALAEEKYGFDISLQPLSDDNDTVIRSFLSSGEAADIILYNSGSLLTRLNPSQYFMDLSEYDDIIDRLEEEFKNSVTVDGAVYGVPQSASQGGGIFYNKEMYETYNLEVPVTWDEFLANCEVLKENGETAVIGSFGSSWTSQLVFLADYYNVLAENPNFSAEFEAGTAKYATTPAAVRSFEKYEDLIPYYNEDCAVATYDDACAMLAEGNGCHYFMLSGVLSNIGSLYDKETADNIGFFAVPGDNANSNGLTMWPSNGVYVNKDPQGNLDDILEFLRLYISDEGLDAFAEALLPTGAYNVTGYAGEFDRYAAIEQMQSYIDNGNVALAQEYETSVKGAGCENICVEVATGQISGKEAAAKYDDDCYKSAVQLGLDW